MLLAKNLAENRNTRQRNSYKGKRVNPELRHFPVKSEKSQRCQVCYKNGFRVVTNIMCEDCMVNLCVGECYKKYHLDNGY